MFIRDYFSISGGEAKSAGMNSMKVYEPVAIALVTVLVLASVYTLGKHSGYQKAMANLAAPQAVTNSQQNPVKRAVLNAM